MFLNVLSVYNSFLMNRVDNCILAFGVRRTYYMSALLLGMGTATAATVFVLGTLGILGSQGIVIPVRYLSDCVNAKLLNCCIITGSAPFIVIISATPFGFVSYRFRKIAQQLGAPPPLPLLPPPPMIAP